MVCGSQAITTIPQRAGEVVSRHVKHLVARTRPVTSDDGLAHVDNVVLSLMRDS